MANEVEKVEKDKIPVELTFLVPKDKKVGPKDFQVHTMLQIKEIQDKMYDEYCKSEEGKINPEYARIQRNLITLSAKMRQQDEGSNSTMNVTHTDFRKQIEAEAKILEGEYSEKPKDQNWRPR